MEDLEMYNGGKNAGGAFQTIINEMPPHNNYIELFLGSGAVMRNKKPAKENIGVDLDGSIIDRFDYPGQMKFKKQNCLDFLKNSALPGNIDTFIYADPPYLFETRKSQRPIYKYEFTKDEHARLLKKLLTLECMICISGYESDLYNDLLVGWRKVYYYQVDRAGRKRKECLWCNFPKPKQLHDYSHLGKDFTDRQRIKRKINRHVSKLKALPLHERNAIIGAIYRHA
jgi:site-specific DNA-adenine methylase